MIFTNISLNKFHDFSNEETIHLAKCFWSSLNDLDPLTGVVFIYYYYYYFFFLLVFDLIIWIFF